MAPRLLLKLHIQVLKFEPVYFRARFIAFSDYLFHFHKVVQYIHVDRRCEKVWCFFVV